MKIFFVCLVIFFIIIFLPAKAIAEWSYVLPYPSFMPGSKFYILSQVKDQILKYWYFGNIGQFKYNLMLSDKHLVEAKTLFEYKQYLLAERSSIKSDAYFIASYHFLGKAKHEGKNTSQKEQLLKDASLKHIEVLEKIKKEVPEQFTWRPEKDKPSLLYLWNSLRKSIDIRKSYS